LRYKVLVGIFSDYFRNRKTFLLYGYGLVNVVKLMFLISTLSTISKEWKIILYSSANILDRILNAARDIPRDAIISDYTPFEHLRTNIAFRRFCGYLGTMLGCISALIYTYFSHNFFLIFSAVYLLSFLPIPIIWFKIKESSSVKTEKFLGEGSLKNLLSEKKILYVVFFAIFLMFIMKVNEVFIWKTAIVEKISHIEILGRYIELKSPLYFTFFYGACIFSTLFLTKIFNHFNSLIFGFFCLICAHIINIFPLTLLSVFVSVFLYAVSGSLMETNLMPVILEITKTAKWKATVVGICGVVIGFSVATSSEIFSILKNTCNLSDLSRYAIFPMSLSLISLFSIKRFFNKKEVK